MKNYTIEKNKYNGDYWYYVKAVNGWQVVATAKSKKGFEQAIKNLKKRIK